MRNIAKLSLLGMTLSAMTLASCADDNHNLRASSVGARSASADDGSSGNGGNGGSGGSGGSGSASSAGGSGGSGGSGSGSGALGSTNILVAGGNVLVGAASQFAALTSGTNGLVPLGGTVNATVTAVLGNSGHTLVELGNGTSVLLNGTGGGLGDVLSLNLGSGKVVGGPSGSPLIGANVLAANPVSGTLATVNAASGNQLVGVTVLDSALGSVGGGSSTGGGAGNGNNVVIAPALAPALGLGTTVNGAVNATVGGLLGH